MRSGRIDLQYQCQYPFLNKGLLVLSSMVICSQYVYLIGTHCDDKVSTCSCASKIPLQSSMLYGLDVKTSGRTVSFYPGGVCKLSDSNAV